MVTCGRLFSLAGHPYSAITSTTRPGVRFGSAVAKRVRRGEDGSLAELWSPGSLLGAGFVVVEFYRGLSERSYETDEDRSDDPLAVSRAWSQREGCRER